MKIKIHFPGKICSLPTLVSDVVAKARRAATHTAAATAAVISSSLSFVQFKPLLVAFSIVLISCLCAAEQVSGQSEPAAADVGEIRTLKIGDRIPDELWDQYFPVVSAGNSQQQMLSLGDFRDKLIILDFWATWCGSCIAGFKQINLAKKQIGDDVKIIPVTREPKAKVVEFLTKNSNTKLLEESIFDGNSLKEYFPHRSIPHYVWIFNGKVHAVTDLHEINYENISEVISLNRKIDRIKKDVLEFDRYDLYSETQGFTDVIKYANTLTGFVEGVGSMSGRHINNELGWKRVYFTNFNIISLYRACIRPRFYNNFIIESDNMDRFLPMGSRLIDWREQNQYCFEMVLPIDMDEAATQEMMKNHLDQYLGLYTRIENRAVECWVIRGKSNVDSRKLQGENTSTLDQVIEDYNKTVSVNQAKRILINESEESSQTLFANTDLGDFDTLDVGLKKLGFSITNEIRNIDVFVITETSGKVNKQR